MPQLVHSVRCGQFQGTGHRPCVGRRMMHFRWWKTGVPADHGLEPHTIMQDEDQSQECCSHDHSNDKRTRESKVPSTNKP